MAREFSIHIDQSQLEQRLEQLRGIKDGAPRAMMRAMNRTLTGMNTDAARQVSARYIVTQKEVKKRLSQKRANMSDLSVILRSKGRPIRLMKFQTRRNKRPGVRGAPPAFARVLQDGSGARIRSSFMANFQAGSSSHEGIFVRTGKRAKATKGNYVGRVRERIRQLHGPGVVQMLRHEEVSQSIQENASKRFRERLNHEVKHLLNQSKGAK